MEATFKLKLNQGKGEKSIFRRDCPKNFRAPPPTALPHSRLLLPWRPNAEDGGVCPLFCKVMVLLPPPTRLPHLPEGFGSMPSVNVFSPVQGPYLQRPYLLFVEAAALPQAPFTRRRDHRKQLVDHSELRGGSLTVTEKVGVCSAWV